MSDPYHDAKQKLWVDAQQPIHGEQGPGGAPPSFTPAEGTPEQVGAQNAVEMAEESAKEEGQEEFRVTELAGQQELDAAWRKAQEHRRLMEDLQRMKELDIGIGHEAEHKFDTSALETGASSLPALTPLAEEAVGYVGGQVAHGITEGARALGWTEYLPPDMRTEEGWAAVTDRALTTAAAYGAVNLGGSVIRSGTPLFTKLFKSATKPSNIDEAAEVIEVAKLGELGFKPITPATEQLTLIHGSKSRQLNIDPLSGRAAGRGGKERSGEGYAGFYTFADSPAARARAQRYVSDTAPEATPYIHQMKIDPNARFVVQENPTAMGMTRISPADARKYHAAGIDVIISRSMGAEEIILINRGVIQSHHIN